MTNPVCSVEQKCVYVLETFQSVTYDGPESEPRCFRLYVLALCGITDIQCSLCVVCSEQRSSEATLCNTGKCRKHLRFIICDFVLPFDLLQIQETLTVTKFIQTPTFIYWTPYGVISHSLRS